MKKVYLVFEYSTTTSEDVAGELEGVLDDGWDTVENVSIVGSTAIYILSRMEERGFNSPLDYLNRI